MGKSQRHIGWKKSQLLIVLIFILIAVVVIVSQKFCLIEIDTKVNVVDLVSAIVGSFILFLIAKWQYSLSSSHDIQRGEKELLISEIKRAVDILRGIHINFVNLNNKILTSTYQRELTLQNRILINDINLIIDFINSSSHSPMKIDSESIYSKYLVYKSATTNLQLKKRIIQSNLIAEQQAYSKFLGSIFQLIIEINKWDNSK